MSTKKNIMKRKLRGQGLVEYALILVLVTIAAVVILGAIGLAVQRLFGVGLGVLGGSRNVQTSQQYIYFDSSWLPTCQFVSGQGTGLYTEFYTDIPISEITVSTDKGFVLTVSTAGAYHYIAQPLLTSLNDTSICPLSIVIQSSKKYGGVIAVAPVKKVGS